jgi:oxygen-independent coproporphyrinogen-3 oxidase
VNRLSLGIQSLNDDLLDRLGRVHSRATVFKTYDLLRRAGFRNLNLDLMFAIPGQSLDQWQDTLDEALAMDSEHLSSYEVTYEDDTPLFAQLKAGEINVDEDLACDMYEMLCDRSEEAGFRQYEVSNYAKIKGSVHSSTRRNKANYVGIGSTEYSPIRTGSSPHEESQPLSDPSMACRHNINYWRGGSFYGLGPSATSHVRGVRWTHWANTVQYCQELEAGRRPIQTSEELSPIRRAGEIAAFGLRMTAGWPFEEFKRVTGHDLRREWAAEMVQLVERGWATQSPETFKLTRQGLRFADAAAEMFLR